MLNLCACGQKVPSWQEQYDLGVRYLSEGNYEEAIIAFTAAIEIDPKQAPAYVGRGDAYIGAGETEENLAAAQADYEQAIVLDEIYSSAYLGLANIFIQQGEYESAFEVLQNGLKKTGDKMLLEKVNDLDLRDWALKSPIAFEELTIGGIPFYQVNIYETQTKYPPREDDEIYEDSYGGLVYKPTDQINDYSFQSGHLLFLQGKGFDFLTQVRYIASDNFSSEQFEPEFREIILGENMKKTLGKLGFTESGIDYIKNKVSTKTGGIFGDYSAIKSWNDDNTLVEYYQDKMPSVTWEIIDADQFLISLGWWISNTDGAKRVVMQLSFRNEILDALTLMAT